MEFAPFFFFLFGLIIGSFLNVVLFRTETGESLTGRSHCRNCKNTIVWYDNIPVVSFLFLSGKCRRCEEKIAWRYPVVELLTGALFFLSGSFVFQFGNPLMYLVSLWWCFFFAILILITFYDLEHMEVPVSFLIWGIAGSLLFLFIWTMLVHPVDTRAFIDSPLIQGVFGGIIASGFFYLLVWMSHERWMGMGDVWVAFLAGMAVGPRLILFLLSLSFTLGACIAVFLLFFRKKELSTQVPFAPYLCLATVMIMLFLATQPSWLPLFLFPPV